MVVGADAFHCRSNGTGHAYHNIGITVPVTEGQYLASFLRGAWNAGHHFGNYRGSAKEYARNGSFRDNHYRAWYPLLVECHHGAERPHRRRPQLPYNECGCHVTGYEVSWNHDSSHTRVVPFRAFLGISPLPAW